MDTIATSRSAVNREEKSGRELAQDSVWPFQRIDGDVYEGDGTSLCRRKRIDESGASACPNRASPRRREPSEVDSHNLSRAT